MPKLIVIGTSHVGALKGGWDRIAADKLDWSVGFFAATARHFRHMELTPDLRFGLPDRVADAEPAILAHVLAINGASSIDLGAADVVLWAGYRQPLRRALKFTANTSVEGLLETGERAASRGDFDARCDEIAQSILPDAPWLGWRTPKLVLHSAPVPDESLLAETAPKYDGWAALARRPGDKRALYDAIQVRVEALLARHGVALLRQPAETLAPSGLTAPRFARGSRRLGGNRTPSSDHNHANADYGALALRALFDQVEPLRSETRAPPAARPTVSTPPSPYADLPARAYWRSGVAERAPRDPGDLYHPRFPVTRETRIATAGSCFAQHVGRTLRGAGFHVLDAEPPPASVADAAAGRFGYRLFSGRYGNVYTARQLAQLLEETEGRVAPALPVWRRGDRFFDAQRPGVEPDGLASEAEVLRDREGHLARLRPMLREADVFVFTFGLTEAWVHRDTGTVYPTAPGTIAGDYDPAVFAFRNFDAAETLADFEGFRTALRAINPGVRFLVTVSPVPLTATASGDHVEVATCYSKAVLRAVCGMLVARHADADYFPSFEIITSQSARGAYYEPNLRNVSAVGVQTAMNLFLRAHGVAPDAPGGVGVAKTSRKRPKRKRGAAADDPCEDALLEAFAR